MMKLSTRVSKLATLLPAVMLFSCALLVPIRVFAESDQKIVLTCTWDMDPRQWATFAIDLLAKTVVEESGRPDMPGTSTVKGIDMQITDQKITWIVHFPPLNGQTWNWDYTLDRYTGRIQRIAPDGYS